MAKKFRFRFVFTGISLLFLLLSSVLSPVKAQQQVEIKGVIVEKKGGEPIEAATVRLLSGKDSVMKAGVASATDGSFVMKNISPAVYLLHISYIGYHPVYQPIQITGNSSSVNLGNIELEEDAVMLGEAVVTAKAVEVRVKGDTVEFNADSYKITEGSMLEDLLKKMPGVEVSQDGSVTVNGKSIKKILVDGKEFFSDDPKVAAKNLPAKMVEKVQTYDRKSDMAMMTGFDDGDEESVINLLIRPGMKEGWFGNATAGYGSQDRYEGNLIVNRFINNDQFSIIGGLNNTNNMGFSDFASSMFSGMGGGGGRRISILNMGNAGNGITSSGNIGLNFSKELSSKFTIGGNIRYDHSDNESIGKTETENILNTGNTFDYAESESNTVNDNMRVNLRMTWKPDTLTQVIITPLLSYNKSDQNSEDNSFTLNSNLSDTINTVISNTSSKGDGYETSLRLEASRQLNNKGRVLSLSLSGGTSDNQSDAYNFSKTAYQQAALPEDIINQQINYDNSSFNYRGMVSFVEPVGNNNFLQLTYSYSANKREALKYAYTPDAGGAYTELDSTYSKSSRNEAIDQRASIAFKSQRSTYNYTVGFNIDPSYQKTETFVGNTTIDNASSSRNVINYSPTIQFIYRPNNNMNMRLNYEGTTSQPTMAQLLPVEDVSDPLNVTIGNPDLKPIYTNNLRLMLSNFNSEKQSAFMINLNGNYIVNDVVNKTQNDPNTGKRTTSYENVSGNYNLTGNIMYNTPLKNLKFSINNMAMVSYSNTNSYVNTEMNNNKSLQINDRLNINYRSDYIDLGLNGNITYRKTINSLNNQTNLNTFNYSGGATTTLYLPYNWKFDSDINYSTNSGYSDGYEQNEWLWNASLSKSFLNNTATLKLKFYDILQQRSNISYSTTSSYTKYATYNTLNSYFMLNFVYTFSIFKGGAKATDMFRGGPGGGNPGGGSSGGPVRVIGGGGGGPQMF